MCVIVAASLYLSACGESGDTSDATATATPAATSVAPTQVLTELDLPIKVAVTLPVFEEWVRVAGGDNVEVVSLVPEGVDPVAFVLSAEQIESLDEFDFFFLNGLGLDDHLTEAIEANRKEDGRVIPFAPNIGSPTSPGLTADAADDEAHIWMDPGVVAIYPEIVADEFIIYDSVNKDIYAGNFSTYRELVFDLTKEMADLITEIPEERRKIVASDSFTHFARRFGIEIVSIAQVDDAVAALVEDGTDAEGIQATAGGAGIPVCAYHVSTGASFDTYWELMQDNARVVVDCLTGR